MNKYDNDKVYKTIKNSLIIGLDINYGRLSLSFIPNYLPRREFFERRYQVTYEGLGMSVSEMFCDIDLAINKFLGIKKLIDERNKLKTVNRKLQRLSTSEENLN